jgi:hypothetical protein
VVIQPPDTELFADAMTQAYVEDGFWSIRPFNGMKNREAIQKITEYLDQQRIGKQRSTSLARLGIHATLLWQSHSDYSLR